MAGPWKAPAARRTTCCRMPPTWASCEGSWVELLQEGLYLDGREWGRPFQHCPCCPEQRPWRPEPLVQQVLQICIFEGKDIVLCQPLLFQQLTQLSRISCLLYHLQHRFHQDTNKQLCAERSARKNSSQEAHRIIESRTEGFSPGC